MITAARGSCVFRFFFDEIDFHPAISHTYKSISQEFKAETPKSTNELFIPDFWQDWWDHTGTFEFPNVKRRIAEELLFSGNDDFVYFDRQKGFAEIDRRMALMFDRRNRNVTKKASSGNSNNFNGQRF